MAPRQPWRCCPAARRSTRGTAPAPTSAANRAYGLCDIGAFEARLLGQPSATTDDAEDIGIYQARFVATLGLAGEAGKLSFEWGLQPAALDSRTPGIGVGTQAPVTRNELVYGLPPGTQIFYRAVAENASGTARGVVKSFTTLSAPPSITDLRLLDVGDDSATLRFTIDPGGAGGVYRVRINGDDPPLAPLPGTGPRVITRTLTGLTPDADHQLQVVVTGPGGQTAQDDGLISVRTLRRVSGTAGAELTVGQECPANALVSWGDGSTSSATCSTGSLTARHTYAAGGRYRVKFAYEDGSRDEVVAAVAPTAGQRVLSVHVTGRGRITGSGIDCPGVCSVELPANATPTLTSSPHAGAQFLGWADACSGTGACQLDMEESRNVAANFSGTVEPPSVNELAVTARTDTTAQLRFVVSAGGAPATYTVVVDGTPLAPVSIGSGTNPQELTRALTGLQPGRRYAVQIVVDNSEGMAAHEVELTTASLVTGVAGEATELVFTGLADACPNQATIDWGDGTTGTGALSCTDTVGGWEYTLNAAHTYTRAARFRIVVAYDSGSEDAAYAVIAPAPAQPDPEPTATPNPTPVPTTSPTPTPTPPPGPAPTPAVDVVAAPAGGTVLVKLPGTLQVRRAQARPGAAVRHRDRHAQGPRDHHLDPEGGRPSRERRLLRRPVQDQLRGRGHEPHAQRAARGVSQGRAARRRPPRRRSRASCGARARAPSAPPASTARPPSAAPPGSSRTRARGRSRASPRAPSP